VRRRLRRAALFVVAVLVVVLLWEGYKALGQATDGRVLGVTLPARTTDAAMPHVWDVLSRFGDPVRRGADETVGSVVLQGAWYTFRLAMAGFLLGTAVGLALAVFMQRFRLAERGLLPYIVLSQTVPLLALAPLVVGWGGNLSLFGRDWEPWMSVSVIAAYLAFVPVAVGALRGLQSPTPEAVELMDSYAASWSRTLVKLRFPAAVPYLVPALKLAAAASVVGTVVAEISTGLRGGIGRLIIDYGREGTSDPAKVYTAILAAAVLGLAVAGLIALLDVFLMRNRPKEVLA
jgi:NitT/TauT family transport system permease protein